MVKRLIIFNFFLSFQKRLIIDFIIVDATKLPKVEPIVLLK